MRFEYEDENLDDTARAVYMFNSFARDNLKYTVEELKKFILSVAEDHAHSAPTYVGTMGFLIFFSKPDDFGKIYLKFGIDPFIVVRAN